LENQQIQTNTGQANEVENIINFDDWGRIDHWIWSWYVHGL